MDPQQGLKHGCIAGPHARKAGARWRREQRGRTICCSSFTFSRFSRSTAAPKSATCQGGQQGIKGTEHRVNMVCKGSVKQAHAPALRATAPLPLKTHPESLQAIPPVNTLKIGTTAIKVL